MNNNATSIEALFEKAENYSKTTIELCKLNAINKFAEIISSLVAQLVFCFFVALFILILNIGMSLYIGEFLGNDYYGFFVMAGFDALIAFFVYLFKRLWIKNSVYNFIVIQMLYPKKI
jgi:hypothetical protein